jgi:Flp pilus assembly protein TadG
MAMAIGAAGVTPPTRRSVRSRLELRSERGVSAVEFAIVLSVLMMFVFGTIQFGIAFNRNQGLQAAAREGARIASVGGTQSEVKTRVGQSQSLFTASDVLVKIEYSTNNGTSYAGTICDDAGGNHCTSSVAPTPCYTAGISNLVKVTATVLPSTKYAIFIPMWGNKQLTFSSIGVFRCEQQN